MIIKKEKKGKKPLVDYFNSHMVPPYQYLTLDKKVSDIIRELKTKEKEESTLKRVENTFT
jgi:hypothetical protein